VYTNGVLPFKHAEYTTTSFDSVTDEEILKNIDNQALSHKTFTALIYKFR
jgi:hypothetical protein